MKLVVDLVTNVQVYTTCYEGRTPLHDAARAAGGDVIRRLLASTFSICLCTFFVPLASCCCCKNLVLIDYLTVLCLGEAATSTRDSEHRTPLIDAVEAGNEEAVIALLQRGASGTLLCVCLCSLCSVLLAILLWIHLRQVTKASLTMDCSEYERTTRSQLNPHRVRSSSTSDSIPPAVCCCL